MRKQLEEMLGREVEVEKEDPRVNYVESISRHLEYKEVIVESLDIAAAPATATVVAPEVVAPAVVDKAISEQYDNAKHEGVHREYHENGELKSETNYSGGRKHGVHSSFHSNGNLATEASYHNGELHGTNRVFHANGNLAHEGNYSNGREIGTHTTYGHDGKVASSVNFQGVHSPTDHEESGTFRKFNQNGTVAVAHGDLQHGSESNHTNSGKYSYHEGDIFVNALAGLLAEAAGSSLSRFKHHFEDPKTEIVVVSAHRKHAGETPGQAVERNNRQHALLKAHLDENRFSYVPAKGGFIENAGKPDHADVDENTFIVLNHPSSPNFKPEGILDHFKKVSGSEPLTNEQGESIEQESVLHKPFGSTETTGHVVSGDDAGSTYPVGVFHGDTGSQYYTKLKGLPLSQDPNRAGITAEQRAEEILAQKKDPHSTRKFELR